MSGRPPGPSGGAPGAKSHSTLEAALLAALAAVDRGERADAIDGASEAVDPDQLVEVVGDHADSRRRNAAIEALARGGSRSVPALVRALRHGDTEVVMFAAGVLGRTGSAAAVPHLVSLLEHPDANVAQQAIDSLSQLRSPRAVDALTEMLGRDPWLRFAAIHALGEIGDRRAVAALVPLVDDPTAREAVVEALGKIGSAEALDHLFRVLSETPDGDSFAVCLQAIGEALESERNEEALQQLTKWAQGAAASSSALEERLTRVLLLKPNEDVLGGTADARRAAAIIVKALHMQPLYTALMLAGKDSSIREIVEHTAVSLGAEIAPTLEVGLGASNAAVRTLACECLGSMGHSEAVSSIEGLLVDVEPQVRAAAVTALMRLGHDGAVPAIGRMLSDPEPSVRQVAEAALGHLDVEVVTEHLLSATANNTVPAATALAIMAVNPHPRHRPFAIACLGDASPGTRQIAVRVLARQGAVDAVDLLEPLLDDPDAGVRTAVVEALAPIPRLRRRLVDHARSDLRTRAATVSALVEVGDSTLLPFLSEIFASEPAGGQLRIIRALSARPDPAAAAFLTNQLGHRDPAVRRQVVLTLASFLSPAVIRSLVAAARDEDDSVRDAVAEALGPCPDPAARDALNRLALDPSRRVAMAARQWLERTAAGTSARQRP
jgi:HEAT repeat protein